MKRIIRCLVSLLLLTAAVLSDRAVMVSAYAENSYTTVPDVNSSASCSLTITIAAHDDSAVTDISGEQLTIYQVASLTTNGGSADYFPTADFQGIAIKYDGMTVEQSIAAASELQNYAKTQHIASVGSAVTADSGTAVFSNLRVGMYLVTETGRTGGAADYNPLQPFLVMVPQYDGTSWGYDVTALPKPEQKKIETSTSSVPVISASTTKSHTTIVKTGDTSSPVFWISAMVLMVLIILLILIWFLCRKNKE